MEDENKVRTTSHKTHSERSEKCHAQYDKSEAAIAAKTKLFDIR